MIRILLVCMVFAGAARAETLPALHNVTGVSAGDVLNVRAEPTAGASVIATLAPDAADVEVVEQRGNWGLVNAGEVAGWAYLKGREGGPLVRAMRAFIDRNRRLFGG